MAEYYLVPKRLVRRMPRLAAFAQAVEGQFVRGLFALIRALPPQRRTALLGWLAATIGPLTDKASKARANLAVALPDQDAAERRATVKAIFRSVGHAIAELFNAPDIWERRAELVEFVTAPETAPIIASGRPTVYVTAHVGAWQTTLFLGPHHGFPLTTVYAREANPVIHDLFYQLRSGLKANFIPSEGSVRTLLRELHSGRSIGLAVDSRLEGGDLVPFFGVETPTNTVAARLALRVGCNLVPVRCERLPHGRYRVTSFPPIRPTDANAPLDQQVLDMSRQVNATFEDWIRDTPGEWICLKRRWPKATP